MKPWHRKTDSPHWLALTAVGTAIAAALWFILIVLFSTEAI